MTTVPDQVTTITPIMPITTTISSNYLDIEHKGIELDHEFMRSY